VTNLVKACTLLVFDILHQAETNVQDAVSRSFILQRVSTSIQICQKAKESLEGDFVFFFALLKLEENKWSQYNRDKQAPIASVSSNETRPVLQFSKETPKVDYDDTSLYRQDKSSCLESQDSDFRRLKRKISTTSDNAFNPLLDEISLDQNWQVLYDQLRTDTAF
jgi:hypothetical protein